MTGRPVSHGMAKCPFHGNGEERTSSLRAYDSPDRGWYCYGCGAGGDVVAFGSLLYGVPARGRSFHDVRRRLAAELGVDDGGAA